MLLARWKVLLVAGLIAAAALFVVGVSIERDGGDTHAGATPTEETHREGSSEGSAGTGESGGEVAGGTEAGGTEAGGAEVGAHTDAAVLGIDLEAPGFVASAVVVSLGLAAAVWWWERRLVMALVLAFALAFAVLDVVEVVRQSDEGRTAVVVVAFVVAILHAAVAALAAWELSRTPVPAPFVR